VHGDVRVYRQSQMVSPINQDDEKLLNELINRAKNNTALKLSDSDIQS